MAIVILHRHDEPIFEALKMGGLDPTRVYGIGTMLKCNTSDTTSFWKGQCMQRVSAIKGCLYMPMMIDDLFLPSVDDDLGVAFETYATVRICEFSSSNSFLWMSYHVRLVANLSLATGFGRLNIGSPCILYVLSTDHALLLDVSQDALNAFTHKFNTDMLLEHLLFANESLDDVCDDDAVHSNESLACRLYADESLSDDDDG